MSSWGCSHPARGCADGFMPQASAARRSWGAYGQRPEGWDLPRRPRTPSCGRRSSGPRMAEQKAGGTAQPLTQGTAPTFFHESRAGGQRSAYDWSLQHVTSLEQPSSSD